MSELRGIRDINIKIPLNGLVHAEIDLIDIVNEPLKAMPKYFFEYGGERKEVAFIEFVDGTRISEIPETGSVTESTAQDSKFHTYRKT
jgi:hypothetical protein